MLPEYMCNMFTQINTVHTRKTRYSANETLKVDADISKPTTLHWPWWTEHSHMRCSYMPTCYQKFCLFPISQRSLVKLCLFLWKMRISWTFLLNIIQDEIPWILRYYKPMFGGKKLLRKIHNFQLWIWWKLHYLACISLHAGWFLGQYLIS